MSLLLLLIFLNRHSIDVSFIFVSLLLWALLFCVPLERYVSRVHPTRPFLPPIQREYFHSGTYRVLFCFCFIHLSLRAWTLFPAHVVGVEGTEKYEVHILIRYLGSMQQRLPMATTATAKLEPVPHSFAAFKLAWKRFKLVKKSTSHPYIFRMTMAIRKVFAYLNLQPIYF